MTALPFLPQFARCLQRILPYLRFLILSITVTLWVAACQPQPPEVETPAQPQANSSIYLNGAGATLPVYLYQRWFNEYNQQYPNVQVSYQPVGSAAGIQQIISETVDFGASDVAMSDEEIAQVQRGVVMLPMTAGSVAIAYNLPGIDSGLKLSRQVYSDIFLGKITRWNAPQLVALNPDLTLPDLPITLVSRSDGSGTTAVLTAHLSAISPQWKDQVGSGLNIQWPAGVGVKSNAGVSAQIQQAEGAIGYVEYNYARQLGLLTAALENQSGQYIQPSIETAAAALEEAKLSDSLRAFVPDPKGADAYPIVTYSWLLAYQQYDDPQKAQTLKDVFLWGLTEGQKFSQELGYVPLPSEVVQQASAAVAQIQ